MTQDGNRYVLVITGVEREDAGTYTCRAYNASGGVECSAELSVDG